jgi:Ni/Co efflux regulator RcnB
MRIASLLSTLAASAALVAAPVALAQTAPEKAQPAKPAATKPAAKTDAKATKVESATAVRTTPADAKKSSEKSYEGCGGSKMAASDA